jgi:hypothetical protein
MGLDLAQMLLALMLPLMLLLLGNLKPFPLVYSLLGLYILLVEMLLWVFLMLYLRLSKEDSDL